MRLFVIIPISLLLFCVPLQTYSQKADVYKHEIGFKTENDAYLFIGQDKYYTNGLFLFFRKAVNPSKTYKRNTVKKIWGISAGQKMYNAYTGDISYPALIDRPFAGYLYGSAFLQWLSKQENSFKAEIQVGSTGPSSYAEEGQKLYHKIFGFYEINGWQYQVQDEFGINLFLNYHKKIYRTENRRNDFSLPVEARIGNTYSGIKTGILFRTGQLNPFHYSLSTNSNLSSTAEPTANGKEFYFFMKPSLDVVLHDATISGGLFSEKGQSVTYDSEPLVFSQELGVAYSKKRWNLGFSLIFKTKEIKSRAKKHQYGIIDVGYRF